MALEPTVAGGDRWELSAELGELVGRRRGRRPRSLPAIELLGEKLFLVRSKSEKLVVAESASHGQRIQHFLASAHHRVNVVGYFGASVGPKRLAERAKIVQGRVFGRTAELAFEGGH